VRASLLGEQASAQLLAASVRSTGMRPHATGGVHALRDAPGRRTACHRRRETRRWARRRRCKQAAQVMSSEWR
jgi:hypothetical protein